MPRREAQVSISRKAFAITLITDVILVGLLYAATRAVLLSGFDRLEFSDVRQRVEAAVQDVADEATSLGSMLGDYAAWDEAYRYMRDRNPTFARANFSDDTFLDLKLNLWLFVDSDGRIVLGSAFDLNGRRREPVPQWVHRLLARNPGLWRHLGTNSRLEGLLRIPGGAVILASRPILTSARSGPPRGTEIMGRYLDASLINRIGARSGIALTVGGVDDPRLPPDMAVARATLRSFAGILVRPVSKSRIVGQTLLRDINGAPSLELKAEMPRSTHAQAQRSAHYILVSYVLFAAVLFVVYLVLLEKLVLSRLLRLSKDTACIGRQKDPSARLRVDGKDEVAGLASSINEMLAALEKAEGQLRLQGAALASTANGVLITDRDGTILWVNAAFTELTGYSFAEAVGRKPSILKSGKHDPAFYARLWETILAGGTWQGEFINRRKDGTLYDEEQLITPVRDETGRITHFVGVKQDITDRKEVDRLKSEFVSTVSHELRTPLTSIRGSLGLLAGGVVGELPSQARALVDMAVNNTDRLVRLINDILDLEKIESGRMVFRMAPLDLMPLIEHSVAANQAYAAQFGVQVVLQERLPQAMVNGDPDRLLQVMSNLLSNAAKFSPAGSKVTLSVTRSGDHIRVAVADQGPGIPPEFRKRIFQRFAQADGSDSRQKGGTGLGLSISQAILLRHAGEIGFESEPGHGSTFFFLLPEWQPVALDAGQPADDARRPRILVCEDDRDVAALLAMMLRQAGFAVDSAFSAEDAERLLSERRYSAMTLDLVLPGKDGLSLLRELRARESTRDMPVVVVSATADVAHQQINGSVAEIVDWIAKPIDQKRFVAAVAQATRRHADGPCRILHVEDDDGVVGLVRTILGSTAQVVGAATLRDARKALAQETFDLVILDVGMPDGSGLDLLPIPCPAGRPPVPVLVFSAVELGPGEAEGVAAALVKSRVSNDELLAAITALMPDSEGK